MVQKESKVLTVAGLMCSFNGRSRGFLEDALRSINNQSRPLDEFMFVDDGSTDGTVDVVRTIIPTAKIIVTPNRGLPGARNIGIEASNSDLIAFLDDDDIWARNRIELTIQPFQADPNLLGSSIIFSGAKVFFDRDPDEGMPTSSLNCYAYWPACLVGSVIDGNGGVMLPKKIYQNIGPFREDLRTGEDLDYWHRALLKGIKFQQIEAPLFYYRKSHVSMTSTGSHDMKRYQFVLDQLKYDDTIDRKPILFAVSNGAFIRSVFELKVSDARFFLRESIENFTSVSPLVFLSRLASLVFSFNLKIKNFFRVIECRLVVTSSVAPRKVV